MGIAKNFELFEDFVMFAKEKDLKMIFYTLGQTTPEGSNITSSILTVSSITEDGKLYATHRAVAAQIMTTDKTTQADADAFNAEGGAKLKQVILTLQEKFPSADLKLGLCSPTEA